MSGSCLWDQEGVSTQRIYFIKNGVFQSWAHNIQSAQKMDTQSTGHGFIDLEQGSHFIGCHNFFMEPGRFDNVDLYNLLDTGLYFESSEKPLSFSLKSGELNLEATGYWVEKGQIKYSVHGCRLKSDFQEMFSKIIAVGRDLHWAHHYGSPGFVVESLKVEASRE
jgi:PmbA protein